MANANENTTLVAHGQPTDQLHVPDREIIFKKYNPIWDEFPVAAQVFAGKAETVGEQEFKWDLQYPELNYLAPVPAGGATVGIYMSCNAYTSSMTTGASTPITSTQTKVEVAAASAAGTLTIRVTTAEAKRIHPLNAFDVVIYNARTKDGGTVVDRMPGRCKVEVISMFAADTGYVGVIVKVLQDDAVSSTLSTLSQAAATDATVTLSFAGGAIPEGYKFTGGHMIHPFTVSNYTEIGCRGFSATRSRYGRKEAYTNADDFWTRLDGQNRAAAMRGLERTLWGGVKAKQTTGTANTAMIDYNSGAMANGDRWFTGGIEDFLLTAVDENSVALYADHVIYVPELESIGGVNLVGATCANGLEDMLKGLGTDYATWTGRTTIPVWCGRTAYSDTMTVLRNMFTRQGGTMMKDKIGFSVNQLEIDGITFEFRKHLGWFTDPSEYRTMGIASPEDIRLKVFQNGDFQKISQREKMPKSIDIGSNWVDGVTEAYFWDLGFEYRNPDAMYIIRGVGLDYAATASA